MRVPKTAIPLSSTVSTPRGVGRVQQLRGVIENASSSPEEYTEKVLVCFDNDMTKIEWFDPEQVEVLPSEVAV